MNDRIDDLDKLYKPVETFNSITTLLFYIGAMLSIALPFFVGNLNESTIQLLTISYVLIVVLHAFSQNIASFYLLPRAEKERRKQLLSNALGVPLTHAETNLYYNNDNNAGLKRLHANLMENSFFGKNICLAMLRPERFKVAAYAILLLFALLYREAELGVLVILTQVFFTGGVLFNWVKLEILRIRNERIYESLYSLHLSHQDTSNGNGMATLLDIFSEYECAKSSASIKLNSKMFHDLNPSLTEEWNSIKTRIGL
ncbi:hypothetical protein BCT07_12010 [Vibrio breoganii]|uniref:hypothetical protein n=1 Tax=Vibrio breoganii TaxID=553239 RepID=UPI000C82FBCD|nr:hypothetical protein [Vibrio breoganii]PMO58459.1 hypothetical protein BCT07_12010 [Vibrio breoganii]